MKSCAFISAAPCETSVLPHAVVVERPTQQFHPLPLWWAGFICSIHPEWFLRVPWTRSQPGYLSLVSGPGSTSHTHPLLHERLSQLCVDRTRRAAAGVLPWWRWAGTRRYWGEHPGREPQDLPEDGDQTPEKDMTGVGPPITTPVIINKSYKYFHDWVYKKPESVKILNWSLQIPFYVQLKTPNSKISHLL